MTVQTHSNLSLNWAPTNPAAMESFWVLAQRFMIRNVLSPYEFCHHFERPEIRGRSVAGRHIYRRLDLARLAPFLGQSTDTIGSCLPMAWEVGIRDSGLGPLKLCKLCAERGFHSALFETGWLDVCPIHNRPLTDRCPTCNKLLSHISWKRFGPAPGALACGHAWSEVSLRDAPDVDGTDLRRLAEWVLRLKGGSSEETWYAVSLQGVNSLRQDDLDFRELVDCLAAIVGIGKPAGIRNAFWLRHFRPSRLRQTRRGALRADWFDATLLRVSRYVDALGKQPWQEQIVHLPRPYETHRWLRELGHRHMINALRARVHLLPLWEHKTTRFSVDERILNTIACALLHKHVLSTGHPKFESASGMDHFEHMCRFSGAPLGCVRISRRDVTVYWTPTTLTPDRLNPRPE